MQYVTVSGDGAQFFALLVGMRDGAVHIDERGESRDDVDTAIADADALALREHCEIRHPHGDIAQKMGDYRLVRTVALRDFWSK